MLEGAAKPVGSDAEGVLARQDQRDTDTTVVHLGQSTQRGRRQANSTRQGACADLIGAADDESLDFGAEFGGSAGAGADLPQDLPVLQLGVGPGPRRRAMSFWLYRRRQRPMSSRVAASAPPPPLDRRPGK
ncbi:hypothetical protein GCM10017577_74840 [Pseudonocardia halophobica]|uniref:Uncharacterized protein n=1 Tax=Pseudonocardia halophobica TaxID=29401 RepID=A0A9W6P1Y6_9PSEU|nr:hypothetical protein GCM10017577_74840 [Pseudonocardia halophobica]